MNYLHPDPIWFSLNRCQVSVQTDRDVHFIKEKKRVSHCSQFVLVTLIINLRRITLTDEWIICIENHRDVCLSSTHLDQ